MRTVYLIGTSHKFQIPGNPAADIFRLHLRDICTKFAIVGIGEEMNTQALAERKARRSIGEDLSEELKLVHRYCDPDTTTRATLEIFQENDIRAKGFFEGATPEQIASEILESHKKRECYWRCEILKMETWPILYICGANHVDSFHKLLRDEAITVNVIDADWAPTS